MKTYAVLFQGRDLDYKIQEYKEAGRTFPESQIIEWFIQLLLGVDYMHERYVHLLLRDSVVLTITSELEKMSTRYTTIGKHLQYAFSWRHYSMIVSRGYTWLPFFVVILEIKLALNTRQKLVSYIWSYSVSHKRFSENTLSILWIYYTSQWAWAVNTLACCRWTARLLWTVSVHFWMCSHPQQTEGLRQKIC